MKPDRHRFGERIGKKATQKRRARQRRHESIWLGLGIFGLVGWLVVVPTLLGLALGRWIDTTWPGSISWTLTLLLGGVLLGCLNAWRWVSQEHKAIERPQDEPEEYDDA